jgi:hypothetical protein
MYALMHKSRSEYQVTLERYFDFIASLVERDPVVQNPKEALKHQNSNSEWYDIAGLYTVLVRIMIM